MGSRIRQLLQVLLKGSHESAALAARSGSFHSSSLHQPTGLTALLNTAHQIKSQSLTLPHASKAAAPLFGTAQIGGVIRQLLQSTDGLAPIAARHVSNPISNVAARSFGAHAHSASLYLARCPKALQRGAGAFSNRAGGKRFQYTDGRGVTHFRARGFLGAYQDPDRRRRLLIIVSVVGVCHFFRLRTVSNCLLSLFCVNRLPALSHSLSFDTIT